MKKNKILLLGGIAAAVVGIGIILFFVGVSQGAKVIASDMTIEGDYMIAEGSKVVLKNGAKLTVTGNLEVAGTLEGDEKGIVLVVGGNVGFADTAEVSSEGSIQVVESADQLAPTQERLDELFNEAGNDSCDGGCIGPFVPENKIGQTFLSPAVDIVSRPFLEESKGKPLAFVGTAEASSHTITQRGDTVTVSGKWDVKKPKTPRQQLILFWFPNASNLVLKNLTMTVPPGDPGTEDVGNCDARGGQGKKAGRLLFWAGGNVRINNITLTLGDGGEGGYAETSPDCYPKARAEGGVGGESGNLKILAGNSLAIEGVFRLNPGNGGKGGDAIAYAADGKGPEEPGGDADAFGGRGADNIKQLKAVGAVSGVASVEIGSVTGGAGGNATALPGNGGNGKGCDSDGGRGGHGTATGGDGGRASVKLGGAGSTIDAEDVGGKGGDADIEGGKGGEGGDCDPTDFGGDGGDGGNAKATPGKGGQGDTRRGDDGEVLSEPGGDGGNGGDGCLEGKGGIGGQGNPPGKDGEPGKNLCMQPKEDDTSTTTPPPDTGSTTSPPPQPSEKIRVIAYHGKYIPVSQLIVEGEGNCGNHYHAAEGIATATDGTPIPDPGPPCGYGAVATTPILEIEQ